MSFANLDSACFPAELNRLCRIPRVTLRFGVSSSASNMLLSAMASIQVKAGTSLRSGGMRLESRPAFALPLKRSSALLVHQSAGQLCLLRGLSVKAQTRVDAAQLIV